MIQLENKPNITNEGLISQCIKTIAKDELYDINNITYIFLSDDELLEINKKYLDHDYYTDVITFDLSNKEKELNGEIYISVDRVKENAIEYAENYKDELHRVMIHGVLHLVGYKDKTKKEEETIRLKENHYLSLMK
jgi:probable rRNA maturation factor